MYYISADAPDVAPVWFNKLLKYVKKFLYLKIIFIFTM